MAGMVVIQTSLADVYSRLWSLGFLKLGSAVKHHGTSGSLEAIHPELAMKHTHFHEET